MVKHIRNREAEGAQCTPCTSYSKGRSDLDLSILYSQPNTSSKIISAKMMSFLFPEDLSVAHPSVNKQPSFNTTESSTAPTSTPPMPSRSPPALPSLETPPLPAYAPPPLPATKEKPLISVTQLDLPALQDDARRSKSHRSDQGRMSLSRLRSKREAKSAAKREKITTEVDVFLPPLSPVVDDEFWRTGRYPTSPQSAGVAFAPF